MAKIKTVLFFTTLNLHPSFHEYSLITRKLSSLLYSISSLQKQHQFIFIVIIYHIFIQIEMRYFHIIRTICTPFRTHSPTKFNLHSSSFSSSSTSNHSKLDVDSILASLNLHRNSDSGTFSTILTTIHARKMNKNLNFFWVFFILTNYVNGYCYIQEKKSGFIFV